MQKEACMAFLSYLVGSGSAHLPDIILTSSSSPHSSISKGCLSSRSLDNCLSQLTQVMTQISPKKPFQSKWHTLFLFLNHSLLSSSSFLNYLFLTVLGFFLLAESRATLHCGGFSCGARALGAPGCSSWGSRPQVP